MAIDFSSPVAEGVEDGINWVTKSAPVYGAVNGYVQLPEGHPWREAADIQHGNPDIDVHGGITYGVDENGWIGFDTLHAFDRWPGEAEYWRRRGQPGLAHPENEAHAKYWMPELVADEARKLARLAAAAVTEVTA